MKLGFYYHIPLSYSGANYYLPGYLAVFVDSLAREVDHLTLFLHEEDFNNKDADTPLLEKNIAWVNLGKKTSAWRRSFFFRNVLSPKVAEFEKVDILLIRCPSPLAPYFNKVGIKKTRLAYLVVGDYGEGAKHWKANSLRHLLIKYYLQWNDAALKKAVGGQLVFINSAILYETYKQKTSNIHLVRTTTLSASDFWKKTQFEIFAPAKIAYIGRFDLQKGLMELVEAVSILINKGILVELHMTGWDASSEKKVEKTLLRYATHLGVNSFLFWNGKKRVGEELNQMYRDADLYLLPSYHEGFPRTIWEAMANSCPVIATKVGSIPDYLEHGKHAWLIEPRSIDAIAEAIQYLIENYDVRQKLIKHGYALAMENTLEVQTKNLVDILKNEINAG